jgi:hypothetical protein
MHDNYTITYDSKYYKPISEKMFAMLPKSLQKKKHRSWQFKNTLAGLMLGYGSLYNHSDDPNAEVWWGACETFIMESLKDIKAGEEIFIDYGSDYWEASGGIPIDKKNLDGTLAENKKDKKKKTKAKSALYKDPNEEVKKASGAAKKVTTVCKKKPSSSSKAEKKVTKVTTKVKKHKQ